MYRIETKLALYFSFSSCQRGLWSGRFRRVRGWSPWWNHNEKVGPMQESEKETERPVVSAQLNVQETEQRWLWRSGGGNEVERLLTTTFSDEFLLRSHLQCTGGKECAFGRGSGGSEDTGTADPWGYHRYCTTSRAQGEDLRETKEGLGPRTETEHWFGAKSITGSALECLQSDPFISCMQATIDRHSQVPSDPGVSYPV